MSAEKGKIILSDGSMKEFDSEKTIIRQMASGNLTVNNDTVRLIGPVDKISGKKMNRIIIPYGKRSEVTLSDGTHIWLNSGSQLSYPSVFGSDSRQVFLSGEAFFEVSKDKTKPFYVSVKNFKIKVLGTKFNVTAYEEDSVIRTVLQEGKVTASKDQLFAKETVLSPGEEIVFDKENGNTEKAKVDVLLYTSWVSGYLIFHNESTLEVLKKLERYYNRQIKAGVNLENKTFSGKLDLKEDIHNVLENVAYASSLEVTEQDNMFLIK